MKASSFTVVHWAPHGLVALKHFHFSAKPCLTFNITPSVETFTQRANAGINITLLSICDLPALHPPSECSPTMKKCKGEGRRLFYYSLIHWWYTSSRMGDSIQTMKEWENPHPVCSTLGIWGSRFHLLQQTGWKLNIFMTAIILRTFKFSFFFFAVSWKILRPCCDKQHSRPSSESLRKRLSSWVCVLVHFRTSGSDEAQKPHEKANGDGRPPLDRASLELTSLSRTCLPSSSRVALWETYQTFLPPGQFDTTRTTAAGICTFADFNRIWLQKQASMKWRCEIFIDIYKLEDNKKNFRPATLWGSFLHWFGAAFPSELGKTKYVSLRVCVRATGDLPSLSRSINQKTMLPRQPTFLEKEFYVWYKLWKHYVTFRMAAICWSLSGLIKPLLCCWGTIFWQEKSKKVL